MGKKSKSIYNKSGAVYTVTEKESFISFAKVKLIIGAVLAVVAFAVTMIFKGNVRTGAILFAAFIVTAPFKLGYRRIFTQILYAVWGIAASFGTVWLTQYLLRFGLKDISKVKIAFGMLCCMIVYALIYIITQHFRFSVLLGSALLLILATANYYVYLFRGGELAPLDLFAFKTAMNVAGGYTFSVPKEMAYAWVLFALFALVSYCMPDIAHDKPFSFKRIGAGLLAEAVLVGVLVIFGFGHYSANSWLQEGTQLHGYIFNFTLKIKQSFVSKPDPYDLNRIGELADRYEAAQNANGGDYPNVIVIMNESFADLSVLGSELKTNTEIMPFVKSMKEDTIKGYALSSVYGGGTPNSEYEFLSGNSMSLFPDNTIVYQQYVDDDSYTMVSAFKELGYTCIGMHPYKSNGWMRKVVYPCLGFDECYFDSDFTDPKLMRGVVSDEGMYDKIIECYENKGRNEKLFLFGVTMQNHGGYKYTGSDFETTVSLDRYRGDYSEEEQYLQLVIESDKAIEKLIKYFSKADQRTVVVFYGDHLPRISDELVTELHGGEFDTLDEQMQRYKVPFFVWANYDIDEEEIECTSINFLSNYMFKAAGIPEPSYNEFLEDVQKDIPAMNILGYYSLEKKRFLHYNEAEGRELKALRNFRMVSYNGVFDSRNRNETFFPIVK